MFFLYLFLVQQLGFDPGRAFVSGGIPRSGVVVLLLVVLANFAGEAQAGLDGMQLLPSDHWLSVERRDV